MIRTISWIALLAVLAAYGIWAFATVDRRDDDTQIRSMIAGTAAAIQDRDLGHTITCLSRDYKDDDGLTYDRLRMLTAQALRMDAEFTTLVDISSLRIDGKKATVNVHAIVKGDGGGSLYNKHLTLVFHKERGRHAMVVPVDVWRVVKVNGLGLQAETAF